MEALAKDSPLGEEQLLSKFLRSLSDHDEMSIADFFRRLRAAPQRRARPAGAVIDVSEVVSRLKSALPSDDAFHRAMDALSRQKAATKPLLTQVFYGLFERTQGVPKKATRAELLRLIEDERNIVIGNMKMRDLLSRRAVPAE